MSQRLRAYSVLLYPHTVPSRVILCVAAFLVTRSFGATSSASSVVVIAVVLIVVGQQHQTGFVSSHQLT